MAHCGIVGQTLSGKSTLAMKLAEDYRKRGIDVLTLDPIGDPAWHNVSTYCTHNAAEFLEVVKQSRRCALMVDESGETVGRYNQEMFFLATRARHLGHRSHFITQRPQQINKTVRDQWSTMFLFAPSIDDCKVFANEWGKPELKNAVDDLQQFEFYKVQRFKPLEKQRLVI